MKWEAHCSGNAGLELGVSGACSRVRTAALDQPPEA